MRFQIHHSVWPRTVIFALMLWSSGAGWVNAQTAGQKAPVAASSKAVLASDPIPLFGDKVTVPLVPKLFYSAALSSNDRWLAGGVGDWTTSGEILVWDVAQRQQIIRHTLGRGIRSLAFSPDNTLLAIGSFSNELLIVEVPSGAIVAHWLPHTGGINGLAFSRDGKLLASASLDKTVKLWTVTRPADPKQGLPAESTFDGHNDWVFTVAFSHDGKMLYSGGREPKVFVWDVVNKRPETVWSDVPAGVESIAVSRDGDAVALGLWDGTVELRKPADGALTAKLEHLAGGANTVGMVSFSRDGTSLASSAHDGTAKIWDFPAGKLRTTIKAHIGRAWGALLTSDASRLVTAGSDGHVRLWNAKTSERLYQFPDNLAPTETSNPITAVAWQNDPSTVLTAHADRSVRLRHTITGQTMQMVVAPAEMISLATSPDARFAVGAGKDRAVYLFELLLSKSGMLNAPVALPGHQNDLTSVAFSSDGRHAYSADYDGVIQRWDVATRKGDKILKAGNKSIQCLACSDDGQWLAAGDITGAIQLWDLKQGGTQPVTELKGHQAIVTAVAFASQAPVLASGSADHTALVWNLAGLKGNDSKNPAAELTPVKFSGHSEMVTRLALSPRGTWLVTGGEDKTVRVWDTRTGSLFKLIANPSSCRSLAFKSELLMLVRTDRFLDLWPFKRGITFPKADGRYVKLRALSAIQPGDPFASAAEIDLFQAGQPIAKAGWKVVAVDSENKGNEGQLAFDGNPATFWHTKWQTDKPTLQPHELVIDLGRRYGITGLFVQSRSDDSRNGTIKNYELYIGDDPQKFGKPVIAGELNPAVPPKR